MQLCTATDVDDQAPLRTAKTMTAKNVACPIIHAARKLTTSLRALHAAQMRLLFR
jgi:hypothetical protein